MSEPVSLERLHDDYRRQGIRLVLAGSSARIRLKLRRAGLHLHKGSLAYVRTSQQAREKALRLIA
ncbi:hypothetical protein [Stutzerimonas urumqiensis]|uniref:hypothetical protein n=1 Tax=Stutzerimonas urumqiensis TaxID=638269 RepID=UPI003BA9B4F9